jgi:hypothetical protein
MRRLCIAILLIASAVTSTLPATIELVVARKFMLKGELEDLVTFGLLKEMTCDSDGNIFSPSNRKYGDAINAIVRFPHDAGSFRKFSIDALAHLVDGTITDFDLEPNGDLYVLARQVLKYSDLEVPIAFGENFILHYDQSGSVVSQVLLKLDTHNFAPTGLAVLKDGEYLVVGHRQAESNTFIVVELFHFDGNLKARFELSQGGTKTSNRGTVASPRVIHPLAVKANGFVYVMRGTTTEPVYVLSETGRQLKTIQLRPSGLEFDSPKILGNSLVVSAHSALSGEKETGIQIRTGPQRRSFPVFNLETGDIVDEYYWHEESLGLACYAPGMVTFIGQDLSTRPPGWAIFEAKPKRPAEVERSVTGR